MAIIGVIPAAGYATRLQPLACSKEVYPIGGRPVMDQLIDRLRAARCDEIRVVTRPEKRDVVANAERRGATVVEARPASLSESLRRGVDGLQPGDVVLIGFPDTLWEPVAGFVPLLGLIGRGWDVALGLFRPDPRDLPRYEPVLADADGRVRRIEFKPERPSSPWTWGCAATRAEVVRGLDGPEPGQAFHALAAEGRVGSVQLSDVFHDIGTRDALRQALEAEGPTAGNRSIHEE